MENAVEALKMAGAVLLFIIGLSVAILAFTISRQGIDAVLKYSDREALRIKNDSRFYYLKSDDTQRYVGTETIIPTIYRAYKENFKIVFEFDDTYYLYEKKIGLTGTEKIYTLDLEKENHGQDLEVREFLDVILYRKYSSTTNASEYCTNKKIHSLPTKSLYEYITDKITAGKKIQEKLGTFYIEDLSSASEESNLKDAFNKNEKRVITYIFK